ncbi:unnamed protein product [Polarella glacialis]|uniref:Uncharacterized protein n=1 Tax=Polarella glacialis TaxID=89957 RepID=A0A813HGE5_POLGL|nr:unnamed protein product [Polarella glacialis]
MMGSQTDNDICRLVLLTTAPATKSHHNDTTLVKSCEECEDYYAKAAHGKWMAELRDTIAVLSDLRGLARAGMADSFPQKKVGGLNLASDSVVNDDSLAAIAWKLVVCLLRERASSMDWHTTSYPGSWAGMLSETQSLADASLAKFKTDWQAYVRARQIPTPVVQQMVGRSPLNSRVVEDMARLAGHCDWTIHADLKYRVRLIFKGWGHEKMFEDTNQKLRDYEERDGAGKVVQNFKAYQTPQVHGLIAQNRRVEIDVTSTLPTPPRNDMASIFHFSTKPVGNLPLEGILADRKWDSPTPQSEKRAYGEVALFQKLHELDNWQLAEESWKAGVVPEFQFVARKDVANPAWLFSLLVTETSVLCWPALCRGKYITLDPTASHTIWLPVFSLETMVVLPTEPISPLHGVVEGSLLMDALGVQCKIMGVEQALLLWQARRGFASVSEAAMSKVYKELGISAPGCESSDTPADPELLGDLETALALGLTRHLCPDMDETTCSMVMHMRKVVSVGIPDDIDDEGFDSEVLDDLALKSDSKVIKNYMETCVVNKQKRAGLTKTVDQLVKHSFVARPFRLKPKSKSKSTPAVAAAASGKDRNYAANSSADELLRRHKPSSAIITKDEANGRYLVCQPSLGVPRRSISWTQRGIAEAQEETLSIAWHRHVLHTGEPSSMPADFQALLRLSRD